MAPYSRENGTLLTALTDSTEVSVSPGIQLKQQSMEQNVVVIKPRAMSYTGGESYKGEKVEVERKAREEEEKTEEQATERQAKQKAPVDIDDKQRCNVNSGFISIKDSLTDGLVNALNISKQSIVFRIWIVDNSSSMCQKEEIEFGVEEAVDGSSEDADNEDTFDRCKSWEEISESVRHHIELADTLKAPTSFRFLHEPCTTDIPRRFDIATTGAGYAVKADIDPSGAPHNDCHRYEVSISEAMQIMEKANPTESTPLTNHIIQIQKDVRKDFDVKQLEANGQQIAVVIATDALPRDNQGFSITAQQRMFLEALHLLEKLPLKLVIRLCTDNKRVVKFYNDLSMMCDFMNIEILDDFFSESKEVGNHNPWLNYALPLHRLREMGYKDQLLNTLEERPLTKNELREFCILLFGTTHQIQSGQLVHRKAQIPDPSEDWDAFMRRVRKLLKKEHSHWVRILRRLDLILHTVFLCLSTSVKLNSLPLSPAFSIFIHNIPKPKNPTKQKDKPWISLSKLHLIYGSSSSYYFFKASSALSFT